jgi:hypothetical protein
MDWLWPISPIGPAPRGPLCSSGEAAIQQSCVDGLDDGSPPGCAAVIDEVALLAETLADKENRQPISV